MVIRWLIVSLERTIAKSVMYFKNATESWRDLETRFGSPSTSQLYRLQEKVLNTVQEPDMIIAEYFSKVKSL